MTIGMDLQVYNALPSFMRRCHNGTYQTKYNGVWTNVHLRKPALRETIVKERIKAEKAAKEAEPKVCPPGWDTVPA